MTLKDYADHVEAVVRRARCNGPVVLVGQSLGGATVNAVANRIPELIDHLVCASAFCPAQRKTVLELMTTPEAATSMLFRMTSVPTPPEPGLNRVNWRSNDPAFFAACKEALGLDYTDAEVRALMNTLEPDEAASISVSDARGLPESWGAHPAHLPEVHRGPGDPAGAPGPDDPGGRRADPGQPVPRTPPRRPHIGPRDPAVLAGELELAARLCR
ncbi:alpha/beta fold hydrolase [Streptomyces sp. NPDC090445]|uniref:alpha/beta hydrolase n=1 Tax=Streptomyces sp. NPDC090445 TaxID=3365963 RepID=UPI0037FA7276